MKLLERTLDEVKQNSLWIVALGLMLASSGIDGAYMARWMPGASWLGYVLNTTADVAGLILMYWFGRLRQFSKNTKRHRMAIVLLPAEVITVAYSWFFSWRQLLLVLPSIEGAVAVWVAPVAAGFIPLLNAFIGYAQALLSGKIERQSSANEANDSINDVIRGVIGVHERNDVANVKQIDGNGDVNDHPSRSLTPIGVSEWRQMVSEMTSPAPGDAEAVRQFLQRNGYEIPSASTLRRWAAEAVAINGNGAKPN
jgi:hypothetical protein